MGKLKLSTHFECENTPLFSSSEEMSNIKKPVGLKKIF